jgi:hypothetical protein
MFAILKQLTTKEIGIVGEGVVAVFSGRVRLLSVMVIALVVIAPGTASARAFSTEMGECIDRCMRDSGFCLRKLSLAGKPAAALCRSDRSHDRPAGQRRASLCVEACSRNSN